MPMTVRTESGHIFRTDNARAIKLIEAGAQQVDDDQTRKIEIATDPVDVESASAPPEVASKATPKKAPVKKGAKKAPANKAAKS